MADRSFTDLLTVAKRLMAEDDRDLLLFSGPIEAELCDRFINQVTSFTTRKRKASLFLCTYGGDPHAAYRLTRVLNRCYPDGVRMLIGGYCKSAGTLIVLAGESIGFSEVGELGPLDTQITQRDEVSQMQSGLEVFSTLQYITDHAFECFERNMLAIIRKSGQTVSTRMASDIASKLAIGLLKPITAQLDPNRIGVAWRGLEITKTYGKQLVNGRNVHADFSPAQVVDHLVDHYPTHAFVIDQQEAKALFKHVDGFSKVEREFYEHLKIPLTHPSREGMVVNFGATIAIQEQSNAAKRPSNRRTASSDPGSPEPAAERTPAGRKPAKKSESGQQRRPAAVQSISA